METCRMRSLPQEDQAEVLGQGIQGLVLLESSWMQL